MVELDNGTKTAIPINEIEIIAPSQPGTQDAPLPPLPTPPPAENNSESENTENDKFDDQTDTNEPQIQDSDQ
jgi:hypothetical protein